MRLVLASASPRRAELLRAAGIEFDVRVANVDEIDPLGRDGGAARRRLAEEKALRVLPQAGQRPVLGADTVVVVDGQILASRRMPRTRPACFGCCPVAGTRS